MTQVDYLAIADEAIRQVEDQRALDAEAATKSINAHGWVLVESSALGEPVALCKNAEIMRCWLRKGKLAFTLDEVGMMADLNLPADKLQAVVKAKRLLCGVILEVQNT